MTDENLIRRDGALAFSPRGRAFADLRTASPNSRVRKVLGKDDTFSPEFKEAILSDYLWILERPHLVTELQAVKKVIKALRKSPDDRRCQDLLERLNMPPTERSEPNVLCPIWRHENELYRADLALSRYVFPAVAGELYLVTVIFGFAPDLNTLESAVIDGHRAMDQAVKRMNTKRRGVMIVGAFEPDLRSEIDFRKKRDLAKAADEHGWEVPDTGGWVLSGHFFVRAPHIEDFELILDEYLPANQYDRVQAKRLSKNKKLADHLMTILGYSAKYPKPLFGHPTRGKGKQKADEAIKEMAAAFAGPDFDPSDDVVDMFDVDAAIRQWALLMDRLGPDLVYYSTESVHAQKWYSESEIRYVRGVDYDMTSDGRHRIEIHRDTGPFSRNRILPHLKGRTRRLRTRPLQLDEEWERMTEYSGYDPFTDGHSFDHWMIRRDE